MMKGAAGFGLLAAEMLPLRHLLAFTGQEAVSARTFDPRRFGARGDGASRDTGAIQRAIDECSQSGGGTVLVSPGTYLVGTVVLKSNVNLHLLPGATLLGSTQMADYYLPEPAKSAFKGPIKQHVIFAYRAQNISITGQGTIDGHSSAFLVRNGRPDPRPEDMWKEVAGFNWKLTASVSPMVELVECTHVLMEDVTLQNAAGWTLRPTACDGVVIRGIRIRNPIYTPNGDGIDPSGCQNVLISHCDIFTGDDAICIKNFDPYGGDWSRFDPYGESRLSRNIVVTDCVLNTCCNGLKIGVESPGDYENITFTNCTVTSNGSVPLNERVIAGIALEVTEGGSIQGVSISNITMKNVRTPIFIRMQDSYKNKELSAPGRLSGVKISGVQASGAILTSSISGIPGKIVEDVSLENIRIESDEPGRPEWTMQNIPEQQHAYPEARTFGRLPSFGLYVRHAKAVQLRDVHFHTTTTDPRPCVMFEDVNGLSLVQVDGTGDPGAKQFMVMKDVQNVTVQGCVVAENVDTFATVSGSQSSNVTFVGNDLRRARKPIEVGADVSARAIQMQRGRS
jgi:polygalacturonase